MPTRDKATEESKRLAAVKKSGMFGTPAEERFDKFTRMARELFQVPMAAVAIVGDKVTWVKSGLGFSTVTALRKDSYCHHTVMKNEVCLIPDARKDPRLINNPFINEWVFYAGIPLHFENQIIGSFCIGDSKPHEFSKEQVQSLRDLAFFVEQELLLNALSKTQVQLAQKNEELEKANRIDTLTRGWNRAAILEIAETELSHLDQSFSLAAFMVDIDHFKDINDTYGHLAGDFVITTVAEKIRATLRGKDAVGRYGGDEFLAILTKVGQQESAVIAQRICDDIASAPLNYGNEKIAVTVSIGCAIAKHIDNVTSIIERADNALYQAKQYHRGSVTYSE